MTSEDSGRHSGIDSPTRLGREAAGLGFVVLLSLIVPAVFYDWSMPLIANALLLLPVVLGLSLLVGGIGLQRGARWAIFVLSAAAPALTAAAVGTLLYALDFGWGERGGGAARPSVVPWPVAAVILFPGLLLWVLVSYGWRLIGRRPGH